MIEIGRIVEVSGGKAKVSLPRNKGCAGCGKCAFASGGKDMLLEAENDAAGSPGDEVEVSVPFRDPLQASLLIFGLPLLALLVGAIAGYWLFHRFGGDPDFGAILLGAAGLAAVFLRVRSRERRRAATRAGRVAVIRVIHSEKSLMSRNGLGKTN